MRVPLRRARRAARPAPRRAADPLFSPHARHALVTKAQRQTGRGSDRLRPLPCDGGLRPFRPVRVQRQSDDQAVRLPLCREARDDARVLVYGSGPSERQQRPSGARLDVAKSHADALLAEVYPQKASRPRAGPPAVVAAHGVAVALASLEAVGTAVGGEVSVGDPDEPGDAESAGVVESVGVTIGAGGIVIRGVITGAGVGAGFAAGATTCTSIRKSNPDIVDTQNGEMETSATPYWER